MKWNSKRRAKRACKISFLYCKTYTDQTSFEEHCVVNSGLELWRVIAAWNNLVPARCNAIFLRRVATRIERL